MGLSCLNDNLAESEVLEEGICDIQLLLSEEDCGPYGHFFPLLCCASPHHFDSRSSDSHLGNCLYPLHHHHFECCWNSQVSFYSLPHFISLSLHHMLLLWRFLNSTSWTCRSIHLLFYWILFENVMSFHRTKATLIGLLEAGRANEWVVTEKLGDALKNKNNKAGGKKFRFNFKIGDR